jgi:uncharacterized Fe-S center protein
MARHCHEKEVRMSSTVYFASARAALWDYRYSLRGKLEEVLRRLDLGGRFQPGELVAVKMHLGSPGAHRIVRPAFVRTVVDALRAAGAKPFVTDTVRIGGWDYLEVANQNGLNPQSMGCPVILADGLFGCDSIVVPAGPVLGEVRVASAIHDAPAMVVVSHCKGHIQAGYGGAIKNLAMGGVAGRDRSGDWKKARGHLHAAQGEGRIIRDAEACILCLNCLHVCPTGAIVQEGDVLRVVDKLCWRCGRCARVCQEGAIHLEGLTQHDFQQGLAEAAQAVLRTFAPGKVVYLNFALEVQPECDCMPMADTPLVQDQGLFAGDDIVAVEQATLDAINGALPLPQSMAADRNVRPGMRVLAESLGVDGQEHVDAAAELGLGSKAYTLVEVTEKGKDLQQPEQ